jgi:S1-C subfamily serine protease
MKTTTLIALSGSALLATAMLPAAPEGGQAPGSPAARIDKLPQLIREAEKGVFFLRVLDDNKRILSTGTGFLVDDKGALITSLHVVRPSSSQRPPAAVEAIDASGKTFKVKGVRGDDESLDLALLELEEMPAEAVPVSLAGDEPPEQGAYVLVVGHPQGLRFVCTDGIVSAVNKTRDLPEVFREGGPVMAGPDVIWLQTSASVSMGNSGGPMLDAEGRAIGVMQWMARGAGMNFALHIWVHDKFIPLGSLGVMAGVPEGVESATGVETT